MAEARQQSGTYFLQPAEMVLFNGPSRVRTVLGSCVAVVLRVPRLQMACVAHCLLPDAPEGTSWLSRAETLKYVRPAVELMLAELVRRGASAAEIEARVFGGADNMKHRQNGSGYRVGDRNVNAAVEALAARGIRAAAPSVGGRQGRVIDFDNRSGDVFVKTLPAASLANPVEAS